MTIRAKLYAAMVVAVAGLALTAGVGLWALTQLGDRFDRVQRAADARALALQIKFDVTDFNGWQTAYGYDNGTSRPIFLATVARFRDHLSQAQSRLVRPAEARLLSRIQDGADDFMRLDDTAWSALQEIGRASCRERVYVLV